jgi:hypothetical protein
LRVSIRARLTRAQGAISGYVHPKSSRTVQTEYTGARGFPVDAAPGTIEYLELMSGSDDMATSRVWHRVVNSGFKVPVVGGEDSLSNLYRTALGGKSRVRLAGLDWQRWIEAIRKGHTFATRGRCWSSTSTEKAKKSTCQHREGVSIHAGMKSIAPVESAEVENNGKVTEALPPRDDGRSAELTKEVDVRERGW